MKGYKPELKFPAHRYFWKLIKTRYEIHWAS